MTAPIEFVYFDLGNVLLSFDPEVACGNVSQLLHVSIDEARSAVYQSGLQHRFEHGELSGEEFTQAVCQSLSAEPVGSAKLLDAVSDMFEPIASMRLVLERVRQAGFGVGLLSNTCHAHWDWIVRQRYEPTEFEFDALILSYEIGSMKPDPPIYKAAEQIAGTRPERILFLDDRPENVAGARAHRWQAEQCLGGDSAIKALQRAGVMETAC